jgi:rare lipoprotein A (peptidoglycan hydrolase)
MPQSNRARAPIRSSIIEVVLAAWMSFVIYGCSAQAPIIPPPPPPVQPAPAPSPVATVPNEIGPPKVTTASFYGPGLQGHVTSSGEVYNQHAMTAASRTLPIGSHAKVTNLKTGKSVVVRINDHGPFVKGRGIDLSRAAAKNIGIDHHGVAKVKVTRVTAPSSETRDSSAPTAKIADTSDAASNGSTSAANPPAAESSVIPVSPDSASAASAATVSPSE